MSLEFRSGGISGLKHSSDLIEVPLGKYLKNLRAADSHTQQGAPLQELITNANALINEAQESLEKKQKKLKEIKKSFWNELTYNVLSVTTATATSLCWISAMSLLIVNYRNSNERFQNHSLALIGCGIVGLALFTRFFGKVSDFNDLKQETSLKITHRLERLNAAIEFARELEIFETRNKNNPIGLEGLKGSELDTNQIKDTAATIGKCKELLKTMSHGQLELLELANEDQIELILRESLPPSHPLSSNYLTVMGTPRNLTLPPSSSKSKEEQPATILESSTVLDSTTETNSSLPVLESYPPKTTNSSLNKEHAFTGDAWGSFLASKSTQMNHSQPDESWILGLHPTERDLQVEHVINPIAEHLRSQQILERFRALSLDPLIFMQQSATVLPSATSAPTIPVEVSK